MLIETDYKALIGSGQGVQAAQAEKDYRGGVVVIGNFDGVHLGHRALIAQAKELATQHNVPLVVLTFHPHPRLYFAPNQPSFLISSFEQKNRLLQEAGVDVVLSVKFDSDLANEEADGFIKNMLVHALQARIVMVGENFVFGKERSGDIELLRRRGEEYGFQVHVALLQNLDGQNVSSGRVRDALRDGDAAQAAVLLGRPWQITGKVITGNQRGRTIGFPTANVSLGEYVHPALGAYAARVTLCDTGEVFDAIVNIGKRPTVGDFNPLIEAHLLGFSGDLYKCEIAIDFIGFIRAERKFDDLDALKTQITQDLEQAKKLLDLS